VPHYGLTVNPALIEAVNLSITFGLRPILKEVNLKLEPGRVALVIGANGAGKSTLVHALCGLINSSAGQVRIFGQDIRRLQAYERQRVAVMLHRSMLYLNLTARENLEFYAKLNSCAQPREHAARWLERLGLDTVAEQRVRELSRGMEQRLALARAMIGKPELILFDEPFASLDQRGVMLVSDVIQELLVHGGAALLTSYEPLTLKGAELQIYRLVSGRLISGSVEKNRRPVWRWRLS
jgi:heme ABC exporter ATP-binding subunit CcmA